MAAEVGRFGQGASLLSFEAAEAEGVQAGKGVWVIEGLVARRALGQLVDCVEGSKKEQEKSKMVRVNGLSQW